MARIESGNIINKRMFVFEHQAHFENHIYQAVADEIQRRALPVQIAVQKMKSGGMFMGTKEDVITITSAGFNPIYIITRTVGSYLYVSIVTMAIYDFSKVENIFMTESINAFWSACLITLQTALENLGLQEQPKRITGVDS
ncbi:MAG: hypothetical protein FWD27_04540 [Coriobacteriia bacterium]|nr:hypothetical protein [Coriobacteriia bacterium]